MEEQEAGHRMNRRNFLAASVGSAATLRAAENRPNILWLTCEDTGPQLGCYGDRYATTPNLDAFAKRALRYEHAWSNAPVCAPARTTIITGLYPPSTGSEHMRSNTKLPDSMKMFPCYLREAGYYCTNNSKEDYNLDHTGKVWDESSPKAHYRNRKSGQPFFAVFNNVITHESQIRRRPHTLVHDPKQARIPAYHPDTPEVRHDWAQDYDNITTMDAWAGKMLKELESEGLAENTIVFFYGDHGSGMPRSKRSPMNSGLQVPLLIHIPERYRQLRPRDYREGGTTDRLVSFVDLAPTVLSLAGIKAKPFHQGYAFLGQHSAPEQPYVYGFRGRMDERYDMARSVRDKRFVYVRNFMPHRIYGEHVSYMFETPTTQVWKGLNDEGKLNATQKIFWSTKSSEELYDLSSDSDEVVNLAADPKHKSTLMRLRKAQQNLAKQIRDIGFLPEGEIHSRSANSTPYETGHNDSRYPFERIYRTADYATSPATDTGPLAAALGDSDSAVRYWAAMGFLIRKNAGPLRKGLADSSPYVRITAAETLGRYGSGDDAAAALKVLLELADVDRHGLFISVAALNAIDHLGPRSAAAKEAVSKLPKVKPGTPERFSFYIPRLVEHIGAS